MARINVNLEVYQKFNFKDYDHPTVRLGQLLRGLAVHIVCLASREGAMADNTPQIEDYEPRHSGVVTPAKMARYYGNVKLRNESYSWSRRSLCTGKTHHAADMMP